MPYGGPPGPWRTGGSYGEMTDAPPRIGLPPGMASGMGSRSRRPPVESGITDFEPPPGPRSGAGGGSRRGESIRSGSRGGQSRHGESTRGASRHADGSGRGSGRHSSMYWGSTRPGTGPVGPRPFNRRGGPPVSGGGAGMHGALGGPGAGMGRSRSRSRGRSPAPRGPSPGSRTHASGMTTIRGPMPPGMQMGGRSGSTRSSRSGL